MIKHVRDRELVASIPESHADKLADAIRDHLRNEYKVDSLGATVVGPEVGSELGGGAVASVIRPTQCTPPMIHRSLLT